MNNQFEIISKCGSGALSDVFLAHLKSNPNELVAIKTLKVFFKDEEKIRSRLQKEAEILRELKDEKIVKYKNFYFDEHGIPSLVVEYVNGRDLSYYLKKIDQKSIPFIGAVIVSEILLGLEEVHRLGFVHRDIKPENIMINNEGKIKITDFGLSRNLESHDLTLSGTILGSPAYMSPEQCLGEHVDQRSDIFSIGVLLYYLSTLTLPFYGESYPEITKKICKDEPPQAMQLNHLITEKLNAIILKAMAKKRQDRYQKVYEMRADLLSFLDECRAAHPTIICRNFIDANLLDENNYDQLVASFFQKNFEDLRNKKDPKANLYLKRLLKINPDFKPELKLESNNLKIMVKKTVFLIIILFLFTSITYFMRAMTSVNQIEVAEEIQSQIIVPQKILPTLGTKPAEMIAKVDIKSTKLEKPVLENKAIELSKVKPIPTLAETSSKQPILTGISFVVPSGTKVYVDGNMLEKIDDPYAVNPGKHRIKLIRGNFSPIESEVDVLPNEITKINVGE